MIILLVGGSKSGKSMAAQNYAKKLENKEPVNIIVNGNAENISCGNSVEVKGNVTGDIDCGNSVKIGGDMQGDIDCGNSVNISGNHTGDIDAGGSVRIK